MDRPTFVNIISSEIKNVFVTSLKFIENYIFAGQGGDLHIFCNPRSGFHQSERLRSYNIFLHQSIYGIIPSNGNTVLLFGGKNVSVWSGENYLNLNESSSWVVDDWIFDGTWSEDNVILLTAHNVLLYYTLTPVNLMATIHCVERSILYSGKIIGSDLNDIVVLGGTVYQELIIWSTHDKNHVDEIPVLHRLKGHKGVIFCTIYDPKSNRIASTSDDRTVRVWTVKFPESVPCGDKWSYADIQLSFTAFGHTARVWKCLFTPLDHLVTIGEDSQICLWDQKGNLLNRWEHNGELWSLDYSNDHIVVGGNGIVVRSLMSIPDSDSIYSSNGLGTPKCVVLNSIGTPVVSTDNGNLVIPMKGNYDSVKDERFLSYCILSNSPCRNYIALGGIKGDLVIYKVDSNNLQKSHEVSLRSGRIYSLTWTNSKSVVSCGENGLLTLISFQTEGVIDNLRKFILPPSKERWLTCALQIENFLVCGDRMGSLYLYSLALDSQAPLDCIVKLHGLKGVSDIKYLNDIFYTTGRDGTFRELIITDNKLCLISTLKLPMDWAASVIYTNAFGLLIAGFHDVNFILWSVDERVTMLALECGGGHRSFDYLIDETEGNLVLTFIRMKDVKYLCCPLRKISHQTVIPAYHTKSINAACSVSFSGRKSVILTGGEDNSLRLCRFEGDTWHGYSSYIRHISAVRTVKCFENVVVSAGARAQLIIWRTHDSSTGELRLKEIKSHMIRDETENKRSWKNSEPLVDPETRYMDLELVKLHDNQFMIFGACSDGMMRIFEYDNATEVLELKKSVDCNQGCLLKLTVFKWCDEIVVITAGTKGSIAFWHFPFEVLNTKLHRLHSLGINALDHMLVKSNLILGTGGDDSTVALTVFSLNKTKCESIVFNLVEHVHSCQVSGIKITQEYVISVSLDQKLCLFQWSFDGNYLKTSLLGHFVTSISDIHGVLTWPTDKTDLDVLVYGCGFQLLHFNGSKIYHSSN